MKRCTLVLVVSFFLQAIACAAPYNATMGPYAVSFDMGFNNYYLEGESWKATETLDGQKFEIGSVNVYKNRDHTDGIAIIYIRHYDEDQSYLSPSKAAESMSDLYDTATTRMIDGVSGVVASKKLDNDITIYTSDYRPKFDTKRLNVTIFSNYPWDEGTLQLLKTIHVENKTATDIETMKDSSQGQGDRPEPIKA